MFFSSQPALFIAGTDTGVGKTLVTALIALKLRQLGRDCAVLKPFASGCARENGVLVSEDAEFLRRALGLKVSSHEICPIRLEEPLAPLIAARRAGFSTREWPEIARAAFENLREKHEIVLVEGVGGLLAPIWEPKSAKNPAKTPVFATNLDLIRDWDLPAVLVARRTLGTINHTLLTLAQHPFAGLIFSDAAPVFADDIAAQTSPAFLSEVSKIPIWAQLPFSADLEISTLEKMAAQIEFS